jgi:hypothetical protein
MDADTEVDEEEDSWYFGVLNMEYTSFYFLIKMKFNANA